MTSPDTQKPDQPFPGWSGLSLILGTIAIILLVALAGLTCVDVVARYWFNAPVNGAYELTQMMLAVLVFTALPLTTAAREHVEVELITDLAKPAISRIICFLAGLLSAVVLLALSWRLYHHAEKLATDGAVTNSLALSLAPIGYIGAISCVLSAVIAVLMGLKPENKDASQ